MYAMTRILYMILKKHSLLVVTIRGNQGNVDLIHHLTPREKHPGITIT